jgi:protein dithiol oxidoreductase (disulfide-forming)
MQRRTFSRTLAGSALGLAATGLARAQGAPKEGTHYVRLQQSAPVTLPADKKVEVVEFFWYGCPHCYAFEPTLEAWVKRLPADVAFRQVPVGFMAVHQQHQRLFYALEEMGALATMHRRVFAAIHQQNRRLGSEAEIVAFAKENGLDGTKLAETMKGFGVNTKCTRARQLTDAYRIDGVPALGIHGRYYTAASLTGTHERAVQVADYLIGLSRKA